jgi:hypothetical protein
LLSGVVLFLAESWLSWLCTSTCFLGAACGARHHQMDSTSYVPVGQHPQTKCVYNCSWVITCRVLGNGELR